MRQLSQLMPGLTYEIYHDDNSIHVVNPNEITARHLHLTHTPSQQIASLDQAPSPISKLLFEEEPQRLRQLEEAIRAQDWSREYEVVASAVNLLEITARGANKGGMVRRLAELLGVRGGPRQRHPHAGIRRHGFRPGKRHSGGAPGAGDPHPAGLPGKRHGRHDRNSGPVLFVKEKSPWKTP